MDARAVLNRDFTVGPIDERLYGAFLEHLGRAIYTGIYEPGHPQADENGFRKDVAALVRDLAPPVMRYPGGNFVSAYNWEDGVGPRDQRPTRLDLAWRTKETNQIGVNEFADWCKLVGTEMMMAVNLGSRSLDAARKLLEYCNHPGGSAWSDLRIRHGWKEPHDIRLWCLGNEMDGPWQVGHKTAYEYGRLANETAKAMKGFDKSLELIVCGSSNPHMASYPAWEAEVLDQCYDSVDYVSLHMYFENYEGDTLNFFAKTEEMDRYIATIGSVIDMVQAKKRSRHKVRICFDEWNVWYHARKDDQDRMDRWDWPEAPRLLEDVYNFEDVLQVATILNTMIRRSDVVRIACIAQLVNVIAPIMTEPGGPAWRQTIFWPYYYASRYGRGTALQPVVDVPRYDAEAADDVPYLDLSAVHAADKGELTLFVVNRHPNQTMDLAADLQGFASATLVEHIEMSGHDLQAANTLETPERIGPSTGGASSVEDGVLKAKLPPLSYSVLRLSV
ncbi:alpha-N-arabinofuranosidase [Consotaella aegiceratis]|uniref:arabinosylfuranosidase ArfA n=1 Tax=Consotaella aegiceratis TaxID=3097961 RepID=UPI002F412B31